jgi:hypothetical protein
LGEAGGQSGSTTKKKMKKKREGNEASDGDRDPARG